MKNRSIFLAIFLCILAFSLIGCASQTIYAEGEEEDQVTATCEPFAQNIIDGIQLTDYSLFSSNFDEAMKSAMTEDSFSQIVQMFVANGELLNRELINVEIVDNYYRVNYKLTFSNTVTIMSIVLPKTGTAAVSGLWFK